MKRTAIQTQAALVTPDHMLLQSVAEQLKVPLMYVARQAELSSQAEIQPTDSLRSIQAYADTALRLVDSYLLGLELTTKQLELELEPVALSATLYDVAHQLSPLLKQRQVTIELATSSRCGQVMAHPRGLLAGLYNLGMVLSEFGGDTSDTVPRVLQLTVRKTRHGMRTGMYMQGMKTTAFEPLLGAAARRRQPFHTLTPHTGAGIFIADTIFSAMNTKLSPSRLRTQHGLAITLQPSKQLQLV